MSVTPSIANFFGLDPAFLGGPAASSSLINPLLYGSSFQMVPVNFGGFQSGIPPIFGGGGFTGFQTIPFDIFSTPSTLVSPFTAGAAFGNGFGTTQFGTQAGSTLFTQQPFNILNSSQGLNRFAGTLGQPNALGNFNNFGNNGLGTFSGLQNFNTLNNNALGINTGLQGQFANNFGGFGFNTTPTFLILR